MPSRGGSTSEACETKWDRGGEGNDWSLRAQSPSHALQVGGEQNGQPPGGNFSGKKLKSSLSVKAMLIQGRGVYMKSRS